MIQQEIRPHVRSGDLLDQHNLDGIPAPVFFFYVRRHLVVFCVLVTYILRSGCSIDLKVFLVIPIVQPIKTHVYGFGEFWGNIYVYCYLLFVIVGMYGELPAVGGPFILEECRGRIFKCKYPLIWCMESTL